jgi:hypothetical protein
VSLGYASIFFLVPLGLGIFWLCYYRPMIVFSAYAASTGLDYLLAVAGFSTRGLFSVGQGALVILFAAAVLRRLLRPTPIPRLHWRLYGCLAAFVASVWLSAVFALSPTTGFALATTITAYATLPFTIATLITSVAALRQLLLVIGLGVTLSGAIGVSQYFEVLPVVTQANLAANEDLRGKVMEYRGLDNLAEGRRFAGPCRNPNGFAIVLLGGIPILFYLLFTRRPQAVRVASACALVICSFSMALTMSRTGFVGLMAFLCSYLGTMFRDRDGTRFKTLILAGLAIGVLAIIVVSLPGVTERLAAARPGAAESSTTARTAVLIGGVQALLHHPFLGVGPANTSLANYNGYGLGAHDMITGVFGELGLLGGLFFIALFWQGFRLVAAAQRVNSNDLPGLPHANYFLWAFLITLLAQGAGNPVYTDRVIWVILGLCAAFHQVRLAGLPRRYGRSITVRRVLPAATEVTPILTSR